MKKQYDVAAYIWPAYTGDETRTRMFWKEGYGEWQSVHNVRENSKDKPKDYCWERRPLWGYVNEANPDVMEMQINCAHRHGVNVFIYDWYWYDNRPFLENCLRDGYLKARNNELVKFYIMWANHNVYHTWDIDLSSVPELEKDLLWTGSVGFDVFQKLVRRWIDEYFVHPSYYKIDGKPVFMIYDVPNLVRGLGGVEAAREALRWFREECVRCGLPGLHLQFTMWSEQATNLSGVDCGKDLPASAFSTLGFDSATHYQYVHFTDIDRSYLDVLPDVVKEWQRLDEQLDVPYFPHVSLGWDTNPRFTAFRPGILRDCTPENIEQALRMAKAYADAHAGQPPLITINSWNEWTESSYLLPDDLHGYGYLEAVRRVFATERENP